MRGRDVSADISAVRSVRVSWTSAMLVVGALIAFVAVRGAFVAAHRVLGWAAASVAVAALVDPVVEWLGKYIPRVLAVLLTFVAMAGIAGGLVFGAVQDLDTEVDRLQEIAPGAIDDLEARDDELGRVAREIDLSTRTEVFLDELDRRVGSGSGALAQNAPTAPVYFVSAILTIFLLVYGPGISSGAIDRIADADRRAVVRAVLVEALHRSRRTIGAMLVQASLAGLAAGAAASALDLPAPIVIGLVAGAGALLPDFGILLGALPLIALTAALESTGWANVILLVAIGVQSAEALVLRDRLSRYGVDIGPAVVLVVGLIGFTIYGVGMAVYGVVYAVFALAVIDQVPAARARLAAADADADDPYAADVGVSDGSG